MNPWDYVREGLPEDPGELALSGVRRSVMEAFTQNTPSACIKQDDLEALQTMFAFKPTLLAHASVLRPHIYLHCIKSGA